MFKGWPLAHGHIPLTILPHDDKEADTRNGRCKQSPYYLEDFQGGIFPLLLIECNYNPTLCLALLLHECVNRPHNEAGVHFSLKFIKTLSAYHLRFSLTCKHEPILWFSSGRQSADTWESMSKL